MDQIHQLFKSFVESMVLTIDQRDAATAGHSLRVGKASIFFADAVNKTQHGAYEELTFSSEEVIELYYAALLHDIGKIGIRENILLKKNRLTTDQLNAIYYRFQYYKILLELRMLQQGLGREEEELLSHLDSYYGCIHRVSHSSSLSAEDQEQIRQIASLPFLDGDGIVKNLLTAEEETQLLVHKGNLTDAEREAMYLHASYTYHILKDISWIPSLAKVPRIAGAHHEKLDGSGYPDGLMGDQIPVQSRMLAILDMFEALTAKNRPYKLPLPMDQALEILGEEAAAGHIDQDLYQIFVAAKVYERF